MRFRKTLQQLRGRSPRRGPVESDPHLRLIEVEPKATDPSIDDWLSPHQVALRSDVEPLGKLMVLLPGSYGNPRRQLSFLTYAASRGFHAINLCYPNRWTVGALSRQSDQPNCHEAIRLQIIDGVERTDMIRMHPSNSIVNRLRQLLKWLVENHPKDGWKAHLERTSIHWSSIVLVGHSQGGGHAALIAKGRNVSRVVMLAAPADADVKHGSPAGWLSHSGATEADRHFGFVHHLDPGFQRIQNSWKELGMHELGEVVNVDETKPPYGGSHCLVTEREPAVAGRHHGSVLVDGATPRAAGGTPVFETVWGCLLGVDGESSDG